GGTAIITTPFQLVRKLRMKTPDEEQLGIDAFVHSDVLVLDDVGAGETVYGRQVLQEILDRRAFQDRGGLIVTGRLASAALARSVDGGLGSRAVGLCRAIEIKGIDRRIHRPSSYSHEQAGS